MIRSARPLPVFAFAAASLCASAHAVPPNDYRVDVIGMGMTAFDMNDSGAIVGRQMNLLGVGRAFVAVRGAASQLLPIQAPWQSSDAYAISPNGVIVGAVSSSSIASVGSRAAAWYPNMDARVRRRGAAGWRAAVAQALTIEPAGDH